MWFLGKLFGTEHAKRQTGKKRLLSVEQLEDRTLLSNYIAASVSDLIADINASNLHGGSNTITLVAGKTFDLTAVNNTTDGATGLPVIAANDNLTIIGNADTIDRSTVSGTPAFRLFDVAGGASLTLENLTLQGGLAFGLGVPADGGAIYNQGTLDLNGVTVQNNIARGQNGARSSGPGGPAAGGGIYSNGTLTLDGGTKVQNNQALGGRGADGRPASVTTFPRPGGTGGSGFGGGVYVAGGTVKVTSASLSSNTAHGGNGGSNFFGRQGAHGGNGGSAFGGALYVAGGTVEMRGDTVQNNSALGGMGGQGGLTGGANGLSGRGVGGGLDIGGTSSVGIDAFTVALVTSNTPDDIEGSYTLIH